MPGNDGGQQQQQNSQQQAGNAGGGQQGDGQQDNQQQQGLVFETWISQQPADVQAMLGEHTKGLKSALASERSQRGDLERQLREAAKKLEKGSEAQTTLLEQADKLAALENQADFYDAAHAAGVSNLKLAWMAARDEGLIDGKGRCNFAALKERFPELFTTGRGTPAGNAGTGTGQQPPSKGGMNEWIRTAAGRRS